MLGLRDRKRKMKMEKWETFGTHPERNTHTHRTAPTFAGQPVWDRERNATEKKTRKRGKGRPDEDCNPLLLCLDESLYVFFGGGRISHFAMEHGWRTETAKKMYLRNVKPWKRGWIGGLDGKPRGSEGGSQKWTVCQTQNRCALDGMKFFCGTLFYTIEAEAHDALWGRRRAANVLKIVLRALVIIVALERECTINHVSASNDPLR